MAVLKTRCMWLRLHMCHVSERAGIKLPRMSHSWPDKLADRCHGYHFQTSARNIPTWCRLPAGYKLSSYGSKECLLLLYNQMMTFNFDSPGIINWQGECEKLWQELFVRRKSYGFSSCRLRVSQIQLHWHCCLHTNSSLQQHRST